MELINSLNISGLVSQSLDNLNSMFGIKSKVYFPLEYEDSRLTSGDVKYDDDNPTFEMKLLFSNYIQEVFPSISSRDHNIRTDKLECFLPYKTEYASTPMKSKVVLETSHGKESYLITDITSLAGDKENYLIKWYLTPTVDVIKSEDDENDKIDIIAESDEIKSELNIIPTTTKGLEVGQSIKVVEPKNKFIDQHVKNNKSEKYMVLDQDY